MKSWALRETTRDRLKFKLGLPRGNMLISFYIYFDCPVHNTRIKSKCFDSYSKEPYAFCFSVRTLSGWLVSRHLWWWTLSFCFRVVRRPRCWTQKDLTQPRRGWSCPQILEEAKERIRFYWQESTKEDRGRGASKYLVTVEGGVKIQFLPKEC